MALQSFLGANKLSNYIYFIIYYSPSWIVISPVGEKTHLQQSIPFGLNANMLTLATYAAGSIYLTE